MAVINDGDIRAFWKALIRCCLLNVWGCEEDGALRILCTVKLIRREATGRECGILITSGRWFSPARCRLVLPMIGMYCRKDLILAEFYAWVAATLKHPRQGT